MSRRSENLRTWRWRETLFHACRWFPFTDTLSTCIKRPSEADMFNPAADPRRPNTGGFRLAAFRDAAGVTIGDKRQQAAAAARQHISVPAVRSARQTSAASRPTRMGAPSSAGAGVPGKSRPVSADGREVGRLTGLVRQGEHVVQQLLDSLRALKEKNRQLAESDAARRVELATVAQRESDAQASIDELHERIEQLTREKERLAQERAQGVTNAARLVELAAAERTTAQQREAELLRLLSPATSAAAVARGTGGAGGEAVSVTAGVGTAGVGEDANPAEAEQEEAMEQLRIELRLEARAREAAIRSELDAVRQELELERKRHARSRADAMAARFRSAAAPAALCSQCAARAGREPRAGETGAAPAEVLAEAGEVEQSVRVVSEEAAVEASGGDAGVQRDEAAAGYVGLGAGQVEAAAGCLGLGTGQAEVGAGHEEKAAGDAEAVARQGAVGAGESCGLVMDTAYE